MLKYCPQCKKEADTYDNWRCPYCKECWREYSRRYRANHKEVVLETTRRSWHKNKTEYTLNRKPGGRTNYETLFEQQRGVCAICEQPQTLGRYLTLCVDHCHATGKIRGLLCTRCNRGLGLFKDNTVSLRNAINYLEKL